MRNLGRICLFAIVLLMIWRWTIRAQTSVPAPLVGRVSAYPNYALFQAEYRRLLQVFSDPGKEFKSAQSAGWAMQLEEEDRLSDALDQIRARDPYAFDNIFRERGLVLQPQ